MDKGILELGYIYTSQGLLCTMLISIKVDTLCYKVFLVTVCMERKEER